jgi:hypothetical protein
LGRVCRIGESQRADEKAHGETDPAQHADAQQLAPIGALGRGTKPLATAATRREDANGLADQETQGDARGTAPSTWQG